MEKVQQRYYFNSVHNCNMCGDPVGHHTVIGKRMNRSQGLFPRGKRGITTSVIRCVNCGLIYSDPQPVPFDLQDHYGVTPEDYWKDSYFEVNDGYFLTIIDRFNILYGSQRPVRALDIGAGLGMAMLSMQKAGFETYGFEPSLPFYQRAVSMMGISPERLKCAGIEQVEYPDDFFEFISFGAVLEHLHDPSASIIKALQWLRPGGLIQIEVPSSMWLTNRILNLFYKITGTDYCANLSPMHEPFHLYEFHINSFRKHGLLHGYEIAHSEYYVCETYMPRMADFILVPLMRMTNTGMQLSVWLRKPEKN